MRRPRPTWKLQVEGLGHGLSWVLVRRRAWIGYRLFWAGITNDTAATIREVCGHA